MTTSDLTPEQIAALEDMIARRMENTDETREQASGAILNYFRKRIEQHQETEQMITARMKDAGETREQACEFLREYHRNLYVDMVKSA